MPATNITIVKRNDGYREVQWDFQGTRWASTLMGTLTKAKAYHKTIRFYRNNSLWLGLNSTIPAGFDYS